MKNYDFIRTTMAENGFASEVKIGKDGISTQVVKLKPGSEIKLGDYPHLTGDMGETYIRTGTITLDKYGNICEVVSRQVYPASQNPRDCSEEA